MPWLTVFKCLLVVLGLTSSTVNAMQCGFTTSNLKGTITGPLSSGSYQQYAFTCVWTINAPQGYKIHLKATSFLLPISYRSCSSDWVRIESLIGNKVESHGSFCGSSYPPEIVSKENQLRITYNYKGYSNRRENSYFSFSHNAERYATTHDLTRQWINNNTQKLFEQRENFPRIISSLFLFNGSYFVQGNSTATNLTTQYRLQLAADLVRNISHPLSAADVSHHVTALLAICSNPRSFYGVDLVAHLRRLVNKKKGLPNPYYLLTLCNAGEKMTSSDVRTLKSIIHIRKQDMFWLDFQAMSLMTLLCARGQNKSHEIEKEIVNASSTFKRQQLKDGSFGSLQTTSLVIQALSEAETIDYGWNKSLAIEFVEKGNNTDGSFGNFYNLYAAIPVISGKTLLDINASNCDFTSDGLTPLREIKDRLGESIHVSYSLWIGDQVDYSYTVTLKIPKGTKFLDFMRLAAETDEKFQFQMKYVKNIPYVYQIYGLVNDPSSGKYWMLLTGTDLANLRPHTKELEHYVPSDGEMAVMWYKTVTPEHPLLGTGNN